MRINWPVISRFRRNRRGVSAVEFALVLPALLTVFFGIVEGSHYSYTNQKTASASSNILNLLNMQNQPTLEDLRAISAIVPEVARPLTVGGNDYYIVYTAIQRDKPSLKTEKTFAYLAWQESVGNPGLGTSSLKYLSNGNKTQNRLPAGALQGMTFLEGDQVIAVEMFQRYKPILAGNLAASYQPVANYISFSRPRKGAFAVSPRRKSEMNATPGSSL
jgi:hypothetical protein